MDKYEVILADPPWYYYGSATKDQAAGKHYGLMTDEELRVMPVKDWLAKEHVLFMWCTSSTVERAISLGRAWSGYFRGVSFVWVKTNAQGKAIGAQGVRPSITKPTTEIVLAFARKEKGRPLPVASEAVPQVVMAPRPGNVHSRKPDVVQERIESLYPSAKKLEMFARRRRDGWDAHGNEVIL